MNKIKALLVAIVLAYICISATGLYAMENEIEDTTKDEELKEADVQAQDRVLMATWLASMGLIDPEKYGLQVEIAPVAAVNAHALASSYGTTPLMAALFLGEEGVARDLIRHKADVNARNEEGITALIVASQQGSHSAATFLLEGEANVEATTTTGHSALMMASYAGHRETVQRLLAAKAGVDYKDKQNNATPLMMAFDQGHDAIVELLVENKATIDVHKENDKDKELKEEDVQARGRVFMATWLASLGLLDPAKYDLQVERVSVTATDVNALRFPDGTTPLMAALFLGEEDVAIGLMRHKADVNARNQAGVTALQLASFEGFHSAAALLLEGHADVEAITTGGHSALMIAAGAGRIEVMRKLLEAKAVVDYKDKENGATALMMAAAHGHDAIVELLVENKAVVDVRKEDDKELTALFIAAQHNNISTAQLLLKLKADPCVKSKKGELPIHYAFDGQHDDMFTLLANTMMAAGQGELLDTYFSLDEKGVVVQRK